MLQIQLIRVDNRLVHGQVGMTWSSALDIDAIVVVDEEVVYNVCLLYTSDAADE